MLVKKFTVELNTTAKVPSLKTFVFLPFLIPFTRAPQNNSIGI